MSSQYNVNSFCACCPYFTSKQLYENHTCLCKDNTIITQPWQIPIAGICPRYSDHVKRTIYEFANSYIELCHQYISLNLPQIRASIEQEFETAKSEAGIIRLTKLKLAFEVFHESKVQRLHLIYRLSSPIVFGSYLHFIIIDESGCDRKNISSVTYGHNTFIFSEDGRYAGNPKYERVQIFRDLMSALHSAIISFYKNHYDEFLQSLEGPLP